MRSLMREDRFDFISEKDKAFILSFDEAIQRLGYSCGGEIGSGYCWGKYMIIYFKTGVKAKKAAARIYLRDRGIVLRLFFHQIDDHRDYIENAPDFIKNVFLEGHGDCHRCESKPGYMALMAEFYPVRNRKANGFWHRERIPFEDVFAMPDGLSQKQTDACGTTFTGRTWKPSAAV